ncbi:ABC transporter substrate-binding protein [Segnochrobactrum spirostomi]|uniref:Thiamine biosynthesis protein n=1 Tax=Segnochrobactrum spirostomi TaxID=2608987 RepID=A0A6A7Y808_9HYPH|nr:ABC transporter substrate-binding protein [Segnochrobactrum spirostomi]MQT15474.1 thiamine biosynthesis protein [Segnochrobactrum spirostomi]
MLRKAALGLAFTLMTISAASAAEKVTVLLDWFINPDHAPLLVAQQIGAFKDEGLDVEIIPPSDPSTPPRLVAAKQADVAISYQPQLYLYAQQGLPLVRIGTLIDAPLNTVLALGSSGIKTMADFKGKTIGYSVSGIEEATLGTMLADHGVKLSDVKLVNVNFQLVSALLSKQVDGVIGGYRNFEANELKERGADPVVFKVEDNGIPTYDELIILANKDALGEPKLKKFLAALKKGTEYLLAHPTETWEAFAKEHKDLDNELNKTAWRETLPLFDKDPAALDTARYQAYAKFLLDNKVITKDLPVSDYAVELK